MNEKAIAELLARVDLLERFIFKMWHLKDVSVEDSQLGARLAQRGYDLSAVEIQSASSTTGVGNDVR